MFERFQKAINYFAGNKGLANYVPSGSAATITAKKPALESYHYSPFGQLPAIPMQTILDTYRASPRFKATINLHVEKAVGHGYYMTCENEDNTQAKKALELIDNFDESFNLTEWNRSVARDVLMCGNCFITPPKFMGKKIGGLDIIPMSSIIAIYQYDGIVQHYRQQTHNRGVRQIPAKSIMHFARDRINSSPWGEGIGQGYCHHGVKYNDPTGKTITPPSQSEADAFSDHMAIMIQYAGLPKYLAMLEGLTPEQKATIGDALNGAPLTSIILDNTNGKVETIGLQTQGKFQDQQKRIHDTSVLSLMAPEIAQWDSENVMSYASSTEISSSILPLIEGYQMEHARFVEYNLLRPIIDKYLGPKYWKKLGIKFNWGSKSTKDAEDVYKTALLLQHPSMKDVFNPNDVLRWINQLGYETTPIPADLLKKREERQDIMNKNLQGKDNKEKEEKEDNTKSRANMNPAARSKEIAEAEEKGKDMAAETERIFYEYIKNNYAVDQNEKKE